MEIVGIKSIEVHPWPEYGMMLVTCTVLYNGITKGTKEFYVPCIEVKD